MIKHRQTIASEIDDMLKPHELYWQIRNKIRATLVQRMSDIFEADNMCPDFPLIVESLKDMLYES